MYQYETLPPAMAGVNTVFCATGASTVSDPLGPYKVDYEGTR